MAKLGTDGPARRSRLLSPAWWTGPPPISRRGPPRATNRLTRPPRRSPRRKLLAVSGSEPGVNASPLFKEPAARMTRHDCRAHSRLGWTIPATHAKTNSLRIEHPIRTLMYCLWSLIGRIGTFVFHAKTISLNNDPFPVMHQPVDQGRGQGVVHIKEFAPFPEGSIRGDHDRSNFIAGGDNLEQQIGPALSMGR